MPSPIEVFSETVSQLQSENVRNNLMRTASRAYLATLMSLVLGVAIGVADYFNENVSHVTNAIFYPVQFVSEAVLAILAIAVLGLNPAIVYIVTVLAIVPDVFVATQVGLDNMDEGLIELGEIYGESKITVFRHLVIPQVLPYIFTGLVRSHATAWDIVATVEVFLALSGMGYLVQNQFRLLNLPELFSLALIIIAAGLVSDRVLRFIKTEVDRRYAEE